jgi:polar amino acid transport system substrate-binding protein
MWRQFHRLIISFTLLVSVPSWAQHPDLWVLTNLEPPFSQKDERGQYQGYVIELVTGILKEAQIDQQILAAPWDRVLKEAEAKPNVLVFALARTAERENNFAWITPISANQIGVFALSAPTSPLSNLQDLNLSQAIGVLNGDFRQNILQQVNAKKIVALPTWQQGLDSLLAKDIDALFFSSMGMQYLCQSMQRDCSDIVPVLAVEERVSYLALSAGSDENLVETLRAASARYIASEDYKTMREHWVSKYRQEFGFALHVRKGVLNLWKNE